MKFDEYTIKARLAPALATAVVPTAVFNFFYVSEEFSKFVGYALGVKFLSTLSLSVVLLFFLAEFGRAIAKGIFESRYFSDEMTMPTTTMMLYKDVTYSEAFKDRFRTFVKRDFGTDLLSKEEEYSNVAEAQRRIVEAMAFVRKKLARNAFLLKHNIEYGAMRNAIGGAVIAIFVCLFNLLFFGFAWPSNLALGLSGFLLAIYAIVVLCSRFLIRLYGRSYAKILFREYLGVSMAAPMGAATKNVA